MGPHPTLHDHVNESEPDGRLERVRSFIRLMLSDEAGASPEPGEPIPDGSDEEIIMDVDVDGARYLLIRLPQPHRAFMQLSPREQEIVRMVAKGHPNKIIADVLNISSWTVCTHLRRILAKLGVGSRAAMVARLREAAGHGQSPLGLATGLPHLVVKRRYRVLSPGRLLTAGPRPPSGRNRRCGEMVEVLTTLSMVVASCLQTR